MPNQRGVAMCLLLSATANAFHDCIQPRSERRLPPPLRDTASGGDGNDAGCSGGLCVGMHGGPHEGGPASYPVSDGKGGYTSVSSTMTVPKMPQKYPPEPSLPRPACLLWLGAAWAAA